MFAGVHLEKLVYSEAEPNFDEFVY